MRPPGKISRQPIICGLQVFVGEKGKKNLDRIGFYSFNNKETVDSKKREFGELFDG